MAEEAPFAVELRLGPGQLTPLHAAALRNDLKSAVMLVAFGANLDVTDKDGNTPLHYAVKVCTFMQRSYTTYTDSRL